MTSRNDFDKDYEFLILMMIHDLVEVVCLDKRCGPKSSQQQAMGPLKKTSLGVRCIGDSR